MVIYTFAVGVVFGLLRWPMWSVPLLVMASVGISLGFGAGWGLDVWRPLNNPIFVDLMLKLLLVHLVASVIGYAIGRFVAYVWRRFGRA